MPVTLLPALLLALLHLWALYLHPSKHIRRRYWLSFADGISITYIFLELLPKVMQTSVESAAPDKPLTIELSAPLKTLAVWGEQHPFLPLLIGFTFFYGMEKGIEHSRSKPSGGKAPAPIHFWAHMLGLVLYQVVFGYLLAQMSGLLEIVIFTTAILMHFLAIDFHLLEMHRHAYQTVGRWILGTAFLIGWLLGAVVVVRSSLLAVLISFVAGGAVFLIIQDEFAEPHGNSYLAFVLAVILYGALLLAL